MKKIIIIILILIPITFYIAIFKYGFWINNPNTNIYPIFGIDVSHHQGDIDWQKISKNKDIKFVYLKATEGKDFQDRKYKQNIKNLNELKIPSGAYHFFTLCSKGDEQARNFLNVIKGNNHQLPPVVDLEFPGNCSKRPTQEEFSLNLNIFLEGIKRELNRDVIFYTNWEFFDQYLKKEYLDKTYWYRDIFREPKYFKGKIIIWQFSEFGKVEGVKGRVDMNAVKEENWKELFKDSI